MSSKERVGRAIEFSGPDRIPVYADQESDIVRLSYRDPSGWVPRDRPRGYLQDEWGSLWYTVDATQGTVKRPPIEDISQADSYCLPDPFLPARWAHFDAQAAEHRDQYIVGNAQVLCFDRLTWLLGDTTALESLMLDRKAIERLMDRIIDFEIAIVDELARRGADGIRFWDDVGAGSGVIMGPRLWRDLFKPRYRRIFAHIRKCGMHVHWHSCGNCMDIMEDLIEVGAQVFSIGEPFMMGVDELASRFGGRVCFECSPDNRSVLSKGNRSDIEAAVAKLVSSFASKKGGLILIAARDNFDCIPQETRQITIDAVLAARNARVV